MGHTILRLAMGAGVLLFGLGAADRAAPVPAYWYDGGQRRALTLQPDLLAEFGPSAAVQTAAPDAEVKQRFGVVTVFRLTRPLAVSARVSPVFREGGTPFGRWMALPGGVVVQFRNDWDEARVGAWARRRGLELEQKLALGGSWFAFRTAPGLAALTLANQLQESGEVVSASPNWWLQGGTR